MSESIDWLKVIVEYGKRFPHVKMGDIGLKNSYKNPYISDLDLYGNENGYLMRDGFIYFTYSNGDFCYRKDEKFFAKVPHYILLRLLTDGMEDLI